MLQAARLIISLTLLVVALFCIYGFACTFEPLLPRTQWTWRAIYTLILIAISYSIFRLWRRPT